MKLKIDEQRILKHIQENGSPHGMTLGRGRPHDRRTIESLIRKAQIKPIHNRPDRLQDSYAVLDVEDSHGISLFVSPQTGVVHGAVHFGVVVRPMSESEYDHPEYESAHENGIDTSLECYPDQDSSGQYHRRMWMEAAITRSSFEMLTDK